MDICKSSFRAKFSESRQHHRKHGEKQDGPIVHDDYFQWRDWARGQDLATQAFSSIAGIPEDLSSRPVMPVDIRVSKLSVYAASQQPAWSVMTNLFKRTSGNSARASTPTFKPLLQDISAEMPAGSLTAIIGSSGSGKTTLLNTIAHRVVSRRLKATGDVLFNRQTDLNAVSSAYVIQQDILLPDLTVRETLQYAADLRLANPSDAAGRKAIVESTILELGLKECADTRIGSYFHKGCSGGEKRRVSIGVQMLANPSVLFCDEPTTGLDAQSAYQVVMTLKRLAEKGRTVVISIHAPRSEIWAMFDRVVLLARGHMLYSGPTAGALLYFQVCGFTPPPFSNPAEFLVDLAAIDNRSEELERESIARINMILEAGQEMDDFPEIVDDDASSIESTMTDLKEGMKVKRQKVDFQRQLSVLTRRTFMTTVRDPLGVFGSVFQAIVMGAIIGLIFFHVGRDLSGIRSREGALYTATAIQGYLVLFVEIYRLTIDIQIFDRERSEGATTVLGFLLSRRLARAFLEDLPMPIIYSSIVYFMAGFRSDPATFFIFLAVEVIIMYITVTLSALCVAMTRDFAKASLVANLWYTLQTFGCGYFVQANQIPIWLRWLKWTAYNFYNFGALVTNEFIGVDGGPLGQFYDCPYGNATDPACQQYTGRFIVNSLGIPSNWIWRPILISASFIVLHYFGAYVLLSVRKIDVGVVGAPKQDTDATQARVLPSNRKTQEVRQVTVRLQNYALDIHMRHLLRLRSTTKSILHPVTTTFEPGKINVIMGPSGSGKTTLLQSIAKRLRNTVYAKYYESGQIALNGAVPSAKVLRSITSFVTQDDDALIPGLTVRETLYFAAGLRLPQWMSKEEKRQRADDVLLKMGLKECADLLIGNDMKKGISGGEKRRVSIAVQILTDPKVLLLDEPTSGLDAFLASSVVDVLKSLASEGRTIIMSVHQPRSTIFHSFDNVLLLARGGRTAYAGPGAEMIIYFRDYLGVACPPTTNPADFALDLVTVDLQAQDREDESRRRVENILAAWDDVQRMDALAEEKSIAMQSSSISSPAELSSLERKTGPFRTVFPLVLHRSALNMSRNSEILAARIGQVLGLAVVTAVFFAPLQHNYEAIQSRMGFIQEMAAFYYVGVLQNLAVYPTERDTFYRENADGCYTTSTFLLAYTLLELPFTAVTSLFFGALAAFACDLHRTAAMFGVCALNCFCIVTCGESIGIMFCTIFSTHVGFAVSITSTLLTVATTMSGIMSLHLPGFLRAMNYISPMKYLVASMAAYSMRGQVFSCSEAQLVDGRCPISRGEQVLELYNLDGNGAISLAAMAATTVVYRIVAYVVLRVFKR